MNRKDILQILRRADGIIDVPAGTPEDEVQSILAEKEQKTAPQVPITPEDLANIQAGKPAEQTPGQEGTSEEVSSALQQIAAHIGQARTAEAA